MAVSGIFLNLLAKYVLHDLRISPVLIDKVPLNVNVRYLHCFINMV